MHNMGSIVNDTVLLKRKDLSRAAMVKKRIRHMVGMKKRTIHLLAGANNTAMNTGVQVYAQVPAFNTFRYRSRTGIGGLSGNSMLGF